MLSMILHSTVHTELLQLMKADIAQPFSTRHTWKWPSTTLLFDPAFSFALAQHASAWNEYFLLSENVSVKSEQWTHD